MYTIWRTIRFVYNKYNGEKKHKTSHKDDILQGRFLCKTQYSYTTMQDNQNVSKLLLSNALTRNNSI